MKRGHLIFFMVLYLASACRDAGPEGELPAGGAPAVDDGGMTITNVPDPMGIMALQEADTKQINQWIKSAADLCFRAPDSTRMLLGPAIRRSKQLNHVFGLGYAHHVLGVADFNKWEFGKAQTNFLRAITFFERLDSAWRFTPRLYVNLGHIYVVDGRADSAFHYYQHALDLVNDQSGGADIKIAIYMGIGQCMILQEHYVQARHYLGEAMSLAEQLNDTGALANCYALQGSLYQELDPDSSRLFYRRSFELASRRNDKVNMESALHGIAKMWIVSGHADSAAYYFNRAEEVRPSPRGRISDVFDLANVYLVSGDYQRALDLYKEAELELEDTAKGESHLLLYANLSRVHHLLGDNLQALKYKTLQFNLKDSLFNQDKLAAINRLDVQFRLTEKSRDLLSKQLLIAEQQGKIQRQYLGISLSVILILLLLIILFRRKHKMALIGINAKLAGIEQERLRLAQEIHDGIVSRLTSVKMNFNALPDFQEEGLSRHFKDTLQQFDESITELRRTTHNLHPSMLQHVGFLNALNSYVAQINAGGQVRIITELEGAFPGLDADAELHLYRILQELLQNLIKHSGAGRATINLICDEEQLRIVVTDDGRGMDAEESAGFKSSIGLQNLRDRIQLLHGTMRTQSDYSGTVIKMAFPLRYLKTKMTYENKDHPG